MLQEWKPDFLNKLYVYSLCLLVYTAADVSWLFVIPRPPLYFLVSALAIINAVKNGVYVTPKKILWILAWFVFNLIIIVFTGSIISQLFRLVYVLIMASVILMSLDEMKYLLKILTNCFVFILVVSIPPWFLYLSGVPLPHTGPHYPNDFHIYYDYFFFTADAKVYSSDYNRFSSVFLEPGQMATPCMFLFHLNTKEGMLFRFKNIVMLVGVIMSYSLVAYGLLVVSLVVNQMQRNRNGIVFVILTISILAGLSIYFMNNEENAVNRLIISRLEYDEEEGNISGYNRTNEDFDIRYNQMMDTSDKYFGLHEENLSWTTNTSGYKKFIVHNGIVGFAIVLFMMLILLMDNKKRLALVYCIMVIVAFLVRDMLTTPLWMTCAIIGMYLMGEDKEKVKYTNQAVTNIEYN